LPRFSEALAIDHEVSAFMVAKHRAEICVQPGHEQREQQLYGLAEAADREESADFEHSLGERLVPQMRRMIMGTKKCCVSR
jgi:hypothetical protein